MYRVIKTYGNDRGLSCVFRQPNAKHSHCSKLHGYSLGFELVFESPVLDECNWVFDYGGLKQFKTWLDYMFDHTLLVDENDAFRYEAEILHSDGYADIRILDGIGCEKFARLVFNTMASILDFYQNGNKDDALFINGITFTKPLKPVNPEVYLKSVRVFEHAGNSAVYEPERIVVPFFEKISYPEAANNTYLSPWKTYEEIVDDSFLPDNK